MELGLCNTWSFRDPSHCTKIKLAKYRQLHSTARWGTHVFCGPLEKNQGINFPTSKAGTGTKTDISALKRDKKQVPTLLPNRGQWNIPQESQVYLKLNWAQSPMWHSSRPTAINSPSPLPALTFSGLLTTKGWKRFLRKSQRRVLPSHSVLRATSCSAEAPCAQRHGERAAGLARQRRGHGATSRLCGAQPSQRRSRQGGLLIQADCFCVGSPGILCVFQIGQSHCNEESECSGWKAQRRKHRQCFKTAVHSATKPN